MLARFAASKLVAAVFGLLLIFDNAQASVETWKPEFFCSLTQTDYAHRPLRGWESTAVMIQKTLQTWYPNLKTTTSSNPSVFFQEVASRQSVQIIYIAFRQNSSGQWENLHGKFDSPQSFLQEANFENQPRIILLDTCYAEAVLDESKSWNHFSSLTFFASRKDQLTYELKLDSRQPFDISKHFPKAYDWIQQNISLSHSRISFFGLIWLQAWLETPHAPETRDDWIQFGQKCSHLSTEFAKTNRRLASEIKAH